MQFDRLFISVLVFTHNHFYSIFFLHHTHHKKRDPAHSARSHTTDFSVVRQPQACLSCSDFGFFCCPPTADPFVLLRFRILGVDHTGEMGSPSLALIILNRNRKINFLHVIIIIFYVNILHLRVLHVNFIIPTCYSIIRHISAYKPTQPVRPSAAPACAPGGSGR